MSDGFSVRSHLREYSVEFSDDFARAVARAENDGCFWIVDKRLHTLRDDVFRELPEWRVLPVEACEANKTLDYCQHLMGELIQRGLRKNISLMAVGGGILQDLTAFMASVLFRGIEWRFFPTTLLAQADSCIGSKTSINMGRFKNLLGNFYPPASIVICTELLESLPVGDIKSGVGEMLHFYFIANSSKIPGIKEEYGLLLEDRKRLRPYIAESLSIKRPIVELDEFDKGERNLFNYGHSFGHAIESVSNYAVPHGVAVTLGMDIANYLSMRCGFLSREDFERMHEILALNLPDFVLDESKLDIYLEALSRDKKNVDGGLTCILTRGPGFMFKAKQPLDEGLKGTLRDYFSQRGEQF